MDLTTERQDGVLSAEVNGRIDGTTATAFEQAIKTAIEESDHALILDFKNLLYISSAGSSRHSSDRQERPATKRQVRPLLHVGSDSGGVRDQRIRQDRINIRVPGRCAHFRGALTLRPGNPACADSLPLPFLVDIRRHQTPTCTENSIRCPVVLFPLAISVRGSRADPRPPRQRRTSRLKGVRSCAGHPRQWNPPFRSPEPSRSS